MRKSHVLQKITLNSRVTLELLDSAGQVEEMVVTLVTARQADLQSGLLDENAPLGRTLMGTSVGDRIPYTLGDLREVRVLHVESGEEAVSPEAARKRRLAVKKAAAQSEITNQMIFATASGSKWGDYDVNVDKLLDPDDDNDDNEEKPGETGS